MRPDLSLRRALILLWTGAVIVIALFGGATSSGAAGPPVAFATATLNIIAGDVKVVPPEGGPARAAKDGMNLAVGAHVVTGPKSTALVTFLDGSTLTVQPDSDATVKQADLSKKQSTVRIKVNLGTVWARVARLVDAGSSFSLESNSATATVHDGLIGARQEADGTFTCWTRAGNLFLVDSSGRIISELNPGQMDVVKPGQPSNPHPFFSNDSALRVTTSPDVLPLILMADKARLVGFASPRSEVNQVFGAFTGLTEEGGHITEVPAGIAAPFTLIVEGQTSGPFEVTIAGLHKGAPVSQQRLSGTVKKGERLVTTIMPQLNDATAGDPKTAKVVGLTATPFQPMVGPLPGVLLLSPWE
ncbi:MAG: FecR domain-containing protein [Nitrospira sp.]